MKKNKLKDLKIEVSAYDRDEDGTEIISLRVDGIDKYWSTLTAYNLSELCISKEIVDEFFKQYKELLETDFNVN